MNNYLCFWGRKRGQGGVTQREALLTNFQGKKKKKKTGSCVCVCVKFVSDNFVPSAESGVTETESTAFILRYHNNGKQNC